MVLLVIIYDFLEIKINYSFMKKTSPIRKVALMALLIAVCTTNVFYALESKANFNTYLKNSVSNISLEDGIGLFAYLDMTTKSTVVFSYINTFGAIEFQRMAVADLDSDGDGIPDNVDLDDDNDGILDTEEQINTTDKFIGWMGIAGNPEFEMSFSNNEYISYGNPFHFGSGINHTYKTSKWDVSSIGGNNLEDAINNNDYAEYTFKTTASSEGFPEDAKINLIHFTKYKSTDNYIVTVVVSTNNFTTSTTLVDNQYMVNTTVPDYYEPVTYDSRKYSLNPSTEYSIRVYIYGAFDDSKQISYDDFQISMEIIDTIDTDNDGIPNHLDLDSDGDGCPDAQEGGNKYTTLVISTMDGGNTSNGGAYTGTSTDPVLLNLGNTVDELVTSPTYGVPTIAGTGQNIGTAQNSRINDCFDTDEDGVPDNVDIDDDNDGIMDVIECPGMASYILSNADDFGFTTGVVNGTQNGSKDISARWGLSDGSVIVSVTGASTIANGSAASGGGLSNVFYTFSGTIPVFVKVKHGGALGAGKSDGFIAEDNGTYQFTGILSNVNLESIVSGNNYSVINNSTAKISNGSGFIWKSDSHVTQLSVYSTTNNVNSNYTIIINPSIPEACTDTDGDGIPDFRDLDSDDDGCPDSIEASVDKATGAIMQDATVEDGTPVSSTLFTNGQIASLGNDYGANGLSSYLESDDTENATTSYTSTYSMYALEADLNLCTDTDEDGIPDIVDLDDDNDGILDTIELGESTCSACSFFPAEASGRDNVMSWITVSPNLNDIAKKYTFYFTGPTTIIEEQYDAKLGSGFTDDLSSTITYLNPVTVGDAHLNPFEENHYFESNFKTANYSFDYVLHSFIGYNSPKISIRISDDNWNSYTCLTNEQVLSSTVNAPFNLTFYPLKPNKVYSIRFYIHNQHTTSTTPLLDDMYLSGSVYNAATTPYTCTAALTVPYRDTDNDGIPNHLDLDSDGDGCPDSIEAGVNNATGAIMQDATLPDGVSDTETTFTNGQIASLSNDYGLNGLSSYIESDDTENAITNYTSTYDTFAKNKGVNACIDSDNDGIPDITDIDDDNDGVLDSEEIACFDNGLFTVTPISSSHPVDTDNDNLNATKVSVIREQDYANDGNDVTFSYKGSSDNIKIFNYTSTNSFESSIYLKSTNTYKEEFIFQPEVGVALGNILIAPNTPYNKAIDATVINDNSNNTLVTVHWTPADISIVISDTYNEISMADGSDLPHGYMATGGTFTYKITVAEKTGNKYKYKLNFLSKGTTQEVRINALYNFSTTTTHRFTSSAYLKSICQDINTDGDALVNRLDPDSDGDTCSDAAESGATTILTENYIFPGPYGSNGFDNSLETNVVGIADYTSTYKDMGMNPLINLCADSDGDSIFDVIDLDDDNDGILDTDEGNICVIEVPDSSGLGKISYTHWVVGPADGLGQLEPISLGFIENDANGLPSSSFTPTKGIVDVKSTAYIYPGTSPINSGDWEIMRLDGYLKFPESLHGEVITMYCNTASIDQGGSYAWVVSSSSSPKDWIEPVTNTGLGLLTRVKAGQQSPIGSSENGLISFKITDFVVDATIYYYYAYYVSDGVGSWRFPRLYYTTKTTSARVIPGSYLYPLGADIGPNCDGLDTDNDGIPNHLDLDSDGDGCPDSTEAGVNNATGAVMQDATLPDGVSATDTTFTNGQIASLGNDYGSNGLSSYIENDDTDSATTSYTSTYNAYALDIDLNLCTDTDRDGIPDLVDIDDDNDGILDVVESPSCFLTKEVASVIKTITSDVVKYSTNNIERAIDGNSTTYAAFSNNAGSVGDAIFTITPTSAIPINSIEYDARTWGLSNGIDRFKLQGYNGSAWVDLSTDLSITAASGVQTISNTIDTVTAFEKYQIVITVGSNYYGGIYEIRLNASSSFNPAATCIEDIDGDGILNHLDLDSDGDGCPDSIEAGMDSTKLQDGTLLDGNPATATTFTNGQVSGTVGTNGFADNIETTADNGVYNGTYTYSNAIDENVENCTDTDGDGVPDTTDIDDDNDGVLDCEEGVDSGAITMTKLSTIATTGVSHNFITSTEAGADYIQYTSELTDTSGIYGIIKGTDEGNVGMAVNNGLNRTATLLITLNHPVDIEITNTTKNTNGVITDDEAHVFTFDKSVTILNPSNELLIDTDNDGIYESGVTSYTSNVLRIKPRVTVLPGLGDFVIQGESISSIEWKLINKTSSYKNGSGFNIQTTCVAKDTDNDGIPNHLDLDSDGDGCPDSMEAGVLPKHLQKATLPDGASASETTFVNGQVLSGGTNVLDYGSNGYSALLEGGDDTSAATTDLTKFENNVNNYESQALNNIVISIETIIEDTTVDIGENVTFTATVSATKITDFSVDPVVPVDATSDLLYQWQVSTGAGVPFVDIPLATTTSYTLSNIQFALDQHRYKLVVSSPASGCVSETTALLRVNPCELTNTLSAVATSPTTCSPA
ncbi:MAG: hypothetical protein COB98_07235, partial [Flavobacteriaceae bacterium]